MKPYLDLAENALLTRQKLPTEFGENTLRPAYDGLSLPNLASLCVSLIAPDAPRLHALDALPPANPNILNVPEVSAAWNKWLGAGEIKHVVLMLWDAFGYDQFRTLLTDGDTPNLANLLKTEQSFFVPATTILPSTTTTALTSAATGYAPAQHALMGTVFYLRDIGMLVNFLGHRAAFGHSEPFSDTQLNPDTILPVPNIYRRIEAAGIQTGIVNYYAFRGSSISRFTGVASHAAADDYHGYITAADGFAQLRRTLTKNTERGGASFTYMYVPNVDTEAHRFGPLSEMYRAEAASLDFSLAREVLEPLAGRKDVAIILTADHGQRMVEQDKILWLNDHPELTRMLAVPVHGESRLGYVHLKHGMEEQALSYIERNFAEQLVAVPKARAIELGFFGLPGTPLGDECYDRIGDMLLIPKDGWVVRHQLGTADRAYSLVGTHGGVSRAEMLTPFLAFRLG